MVAEVLELLAPGADSNVLDLTVGAGGHSAAILERLGEHGRLIGVDRDPEVLEFARSRLSDSRVRLIVGNFGSVGALVEEFPAQKFDSVLLDLGVSSLQLDDARRGFSFRADGPLDMRMGEDASRNACEIVNSESVERLAQILADFGEERHARRISRAIDRARQHRRIESTSELARIIRQASPDSKQSRIDPATRSFQALRIAVNNELDALDSFLARFELLLQENGRLLVLSYHSLEDRRVKTVFRQRAKEGDYELLTKKPLRPSAEEKKSNPRARSARLRAVRKRRKEEGV